jgi:hypothetical protein
MTRVRLVWSPSRALTQLEVLEADYRDDDEEEKEYFDDIDSSDTEIGESFAQDGEIGYYRDWRAMAVEMGCC